MTSPITDFMSALTGTLTPRSSASSFAPAAAAKNGAMSAVTDTDTESVLRAARPAASSVAKRVMSGRMSTYADPTS